MQSLQAAPPELLIAKQNIDLLEMMEEKTKNNLTAEENQLLHHLLFQLRMGFVQAEKK